MGVMNLGPRSEKQLSANNEHDMYFCALDDGVKLTMLGSVLMSLPKKSFFYVCREPDTVRDTCIHVCHVRNLLLYLDPVMPAVALTVIPWPCSLTPHEEIYWACSLCREIVAGRHQSSSMFPENNARLIQRHEFVRGPASKMYGF
ncbi:uncharacterized protein LOC142783796 [Rhipicephalus microplus]|uniref:uncharacterized protein LOC142783796 n=1 Tax=Rhipicephalus microplus TaxID=6941 RepID=UPI003F6A98D8